MKPTCTYLDMDGVLVDLAGGVLELYGVDPKLASQATEWDSLPRVVSRHNPHGYQVTSESLWATVDAAGPGFWAGLRPYPWADELYRMCADAGPVLIMTTCAGESSAAGKFRWVRDHLPRGARFALTGLAGGPVGEGCKHHMARPSALLVDDALHNCQLYAREQGQVFVWPAPWNGQIVSPHTHESAGWAALERLRCVLYGG